MAEDLLEQRKNDFIKAVDFGRPDKIPVDLEITGWPFAYAGTTFEEVKDEPERAAKAYTSFLDDIPVDCFILDAGFIKRPDVYQAMGSDEYVLASDGITIQHNQAGTDFMDESEYDELIRDFTAFYRKRKLKKVPALTWDKDRLYEAMKLAAKRTAVHNEFRSLVDRDFEERKILMPLGFTMPSYSSALNTLFDVLRGIKGTLIDLRRRSDTVREACAAIREANKRNWDPKDYEGKVFPMGRTVYHSECFLSPKQYDEFFFRDFEKDMRPLMEAGVNIFLKGEGMFLSTLDRLCDLPKGGMLVMLDQDDPFEAHRIIGGYQALAAGITVDLLKYGTEEECVDYARRSFDTFAPSGGFVFSINKPLLCANDAKNENVRAVYTFADEYSRRKI
ncbi:MAG: hypothetical protein J6S47_06290 [Eubacteriaceae bacterium]|nr:hypothetical protein [Eubacteriaceae bacterium]